MFVSIVGKLGLLILITGLGATLVHAEDEVMEDVHKGCDTCHVSRDGPTDDNLTHENLQCVDCHGTLDEVAAEERQDMISPHQSHLIGHVACTACHKVHEKSVNYCDACHSFDHKIPFGGKWERKFVPVDLEREAQDQAIAAGPRESTDIVVIGSGGAGLAAAVAALDSGTAVIVLEKEPVPGGNTKLAAGGMNAAETTAQAALGIEDKVEIMIDDTMKGGRNINDPELVGVLAENSAGSVDWLTSMGADLKDVGRMGGASVNRSHRPTGGGGVGAHVAQVLWDNAIERGADVRLNSRAVRVLADESGRVNAVLVHGAHTGYYVIRTGAVVLATGGFSKNNERVAELNPALKGFKSTNHPGATGDGLDVARLAGAATRDLDEIQTHPTYSPVGGVMVTEAVRGNGAIMVNREGKRFINENTTRDKASAAILAQTGGSAYLFFDDSVRQSLRIIENYLHLNIVVQGDTVAALAEGLDVPTDALEETVRTYNGFVDANTDSEFERPDLPRSLATAPFYAVEVAPAVHHTMGGVVIDTHGRVKGTEGNWIPGLFAGGEVTGGLHGGNRLGGNAISDIVTFGRIAGTQAAMFVTQN